MTERVLQGPFLTRVQAARRAGVPTDILVHRPDLLRIGGGWLEEVYCAFQFDDLGVRPDLGSIVVTLRHAYTDIEIADWLVRPNPQLNNTPPLAFLNRGGALERVLAAEETAGPVITADDEPPPVPSIDEVSSIAARSRITPVKPLRATRRRHGSAARA